MNNSMAFGSPAHTPAKVVDPLPDLKPKVIFLSGWEKEEMRWRLRQLLNYCLDVKT